MNLYMQFAIDCLSIDCIIRLFFHCSKYETYTLTPMRHQWNGMEWKHCVTRKRFILNHTFQSRVNIVSDENADGLSLKIGIIPVKLSISRHVENVFQTKKHHLTVSRTFKNSSLNFYPHKMG